MYVLTVVVGVTSVGAGVGAIVGADVGSMGVTGPELISHTQLLYPPTFSALQSLQSDAPCLEYPEFPHQHWPRYCLAAYLYPSFAHRLWHLVTEFPLPPILNGRARSPPLSKKQPKYVAEPGYGISIR